jgi:flagellar basal body-associated protein FliL
MNKTPIIIVVIVAIIVLCCCSMCALFWTVHAWQKVNESHRYESEYVSGDISERTLDMNLVSRVGKKSSQTD